MAKVLGRADNAVTVEVRRMGGGFGGKETQAAPFACIAALLADVARRPVKVTLDRDDDMVLTGKRPDFEIRYDVGFDDAGVIQGVSFDFLARCGMSPDLVRQANWQKVGGASPPERRSNRTTFLREPCVGSREGAGEASVAAWMGRAIEHRKSDGPGCRGFQIGRRQYCRRRFGEMSASPAVSENPCTFARLLLGPWEVFKLPRLS